MIAEESLKYVLWLLNDCIEKDLWYEINTKNAKILLDYIQQRNNIIKEVRELAKERIKEVGNMSYVEMSGKAYIKEQQELLEILDKVNNER